MIVNTLIAGGVAVVFHSVFAMEEMKAAVYALVIAGATSIVFLVLNVIVAFRRLYWSRILHELVRYGETELLFDCPQPDWDVDAWYVRWSELREEWNKEIVVAIRRTMGKHSDDCLRALLNSINAPNWTGFAHAIDPFHHRQLVVLNHALFQIRNEIALLPWPLRINDASPG